MKRAISVIKDYMKTSDMLLLVLCIIASIYGVFLIYSATRTYETNEYVYVQIFAILLGIALFILLSVIDIEIITDKWFFFAAVQYPCALDSVCLGRGGRYGQ